MEDNTMIMIDKNYINQRLEILTKTPQVNEFLYLKQVLQSNEVKEPIEQSKE